MGLDLIEVAVEHGWLGESIAAAGGIVTGVVGAFLTYRLPRKDDLRKENDELREANLSHIEENMKLRRHVSDLQRRLKALGGGE